MAGRDPLVKRLLQAVDEMQDIAPGTAAAVHDAPQSERSRVPWRLVAKFDFPRGTTYDDIFITLRDWRDDRKIERLVGSDRLTRIQVRYKDKKGRGAKGEYTLSEIGSWELAASRATERVGVRDDRLDSLINRYGANGETVSYIESLIVWFSASTAHEIKLAQAARKKAKSVKAPKQPRKPKAAKAVKPRATKAPKRKKAKVAKRKRRV
jgi:hypothetical protein